MLPTSTATKRTRLLAAVPPFPRVAIQLLNRMGDPSCSLSEVVELLRTDAVFTGEILRLANSPLFAGRCEIKSILHALSFLGLQRVNSLLLTVAMRGLVDQRHSILMRSCWRHNLATALVCQRLAPMMDLDREKCYIAGLIHDIGRLGMLKAFAEYEQEMLKVDATIADILAVEEELFAMDHAAAGRLLLGHWACPLELQNVAGRHENPPPAGSCDGVLIGLVHAASRVADHIGMSAFPTHPEYEVPDLVLTLTASAARQTVDSLPELSEWVVTRVNEVELSLT